MNLVEKMERENRLKTNLAEWMILHGTVISDSSKTNAYATVEIIEVEWQGSMWTIYNVDGATCRIEGK